MMNVFSQCARTAIFGAIVVLASSAGAQSIEVKQQEFANDAPLPFGKPAVIQSAAVVPAQKDGTWDIRLHDINLANTFQRWAASAGWRVRWDARKHVMIEAPDQIGGTFEDAVRTVLEAPGIAASAYPLEVCFYPNTPPVARITLKGDQDKECK